MKLTIEHLKGYLGTGLEVLDYLGVKVVLVGIKNETYHIEGGNVYAYGDIQDCKPLLYPFSSLTEFREDLGFVPRDRLIFGRNYFCKDGFLNENAEKSSVTILPHTEIQKLQEWHIDYQNLIENDLAIDKRTI